MEQYRITAVQGGEAREILAGGENTLLETLRSHGYGVHAPCGGNGTCKQCKVRVTGPYREAGSGQVKTAADEDLVSCQVYPAGDLRAEVHTASGEKILTDAVEIAGGGEGLGLAVDIGTTTVAAYLYDLSEGKCLETRGQMNAQRAYGADVISRIQHAYKEEGLQGLCSAIRGQIAGLAAEMCPDTRLIRYISIAGNTVMEHLFAGLSPESIGVAPFTPLSLFGTESPASDYFDCFAEDAKLYLCPCVAGYVGGDITAGIMSSGAYESDKEVLFIDIGTNGEMGLGGKSGFLCCATAAGPAFEGAEIECGSPAQNGAINCVEPDKSYTVLGGGEPRSICGSGIIDAIAALLTSEDIDETGRMEEEKTAIGGQVYLSGLDVRQIQLAKAAIRAGMETLLERMGKDYDDVGEVLIAGGFGAYMRVKSACAIGLLPPALMDRTRHVGNSAGKGAAMALTPEGRALLSQVDALCKYEELSSSKLFNDKYVEAMMFDEWEEVYG